MDEEKTIKQLQDENGQLKRKIELLEGRITGLEAKLSKYENPHTPPSLKRGSNRKKERTGDDKGTPGQKIGHEGITRPQAKPNRQVDVTAD
jgi:hypothetical protein